MFLGNMAESYISPLILSDEDLLKVSSMIHEQLYKGLAKSTHDDSDLKMIPSYVTNTSIRNVNGKFLALDLGGTNFRVLLVTLQDGQYAMIFETYSVPNDIMTGPGTQLFDHIAGCLAEFVIKYDVVKDKLPLGFTFSFPCHQVGLTHASLIKWTKGFSCSGVEGENVVNLLQEAIKRNGKISIDVVAVLNDTVGTLMSCAYLDESSGIGVIVGTGSNACYLENIENVELINTDMLDSNDKGSVIINCEWGQLGLGGGIDFIKSKYDSQVDAESLHPGFQLFEKMISGMYVGELVRLVLVDLAKEKLTFNGLMHEKLLTRGTFLTEYLSLCESDREDVYDKTKDVLQKTYIPNPSIEDCKTVKFVCKVISTRAAQLVACGLAAILKKMKRPKVTIGCDGSLIKYHPHFRNLLKTKLQALASEEFELMLSSDGSGRGAALVAAAAVSR